MEGNAHYFFQIPSNPDSAEEELYCECLMPASLMLVMFSISIFILAPNDLDKVYLATSSLMMLFAILCHILAKKEKNFLTIDILFLIGFFIVHFQWPLQYSFGIEPDFPDRIWVNKSVVASGTALSLIGGAFWFLGFYFPPILSPKNIFSRLYYKISLLTLSPKQNSQLTNLSIILFIAFLIVVGGSFLSGVYLGAGNWGTGANYVYYFFSITIIMAITSEFKLKCHLFTGSLFRWLLLWDKKLLLLILVYLSLFLSIGARSGPLGLILAALVLIASTIRPVKLKELSTLIILGALIMTFIGLGRTGDTKDTRGLFARGMEGLQSTGKFEWYQASKELADSNRTLYQALSNVPERHDYFYGKMFLSSLLSVVPFGQSIYLSITNDQKHELGSSVYITYLTYGEKSVSGEGTSLIGDIYLNFGLFGVAVFMFFLGKLYFTVTNSLKSNLDFTSLFAFAVIGSLALYQGRAVYFVWLRPLVWGSVIYYVLFLFRRRTM